MTPPPRVVVQVTKRRPCQERSRQLSRSLLLPSERSVNSTKEVKEMEECEQQEVQQTPDDDGWYVDCF